jgi:hypothetical protein
VIGVYPVEADEPCYLVEVLVRDPDAKFKLDDLTQAADADRAYWQAPYDERFFDALSGEPLAVRTFDTPDREEYRLAFFFHYLDLAKPLESSFGPLPLPQQSSRPEYLGLMTWRPP